MLFFFDHTNNICETAAGFARAKVDRLYPDPYSRYVHLSFSKFLKKNIFDDQKTGATTNSYARDSGSLSRNFTLIHDAQPKHITTI